MKKSILAFALFAASFSFGQVQLNSHYNSYYDIQNGMLQFRDSNTYEYSYAGQGVINSNKYEFSWDFDIIPYVGLNTPLISYTKSKNYISFSGGSNLNSVKTQVMNTNNLPQVMTAVDAGSMPTDKIEYTYNTSGKPTSIKYSYFNGSTYDLDYEDRYEYNTQGEVSLYGYISYPSANGNFNGVDSTYFDGTGKVIKKIGYDEVNGTLTKWYRCDPVYSGSTLSYIEVYFDSTSNQTGQLTKLYRVNYTFTGVKVTKIDILEYQNGVLIPIPFETDTYTYTNNELSRFAVLDGTDTLYREDYTYYNSNLLSDMIAFDSDNGIMKKTSDKHFSYGPLTAGIAENSANLNFTVYPNPTKEVISISDATDGSVEITNAMGQVVLRQKANLMTIDVRNLEAGVYTIRLKSTSGSGIANFVKQ